ncbi:esterase [Legionella quinlivanii]|uniref:Esterase n=1 Tax=Legionella quinlivanii TaxID=45073 RepID=A0A0W0XTX7_9GAMM|nr:hotdog fold thioesterase [Legionella quinlivanii]KTD47940.1 esterase [Legionella quinlivanii]SEG19559.1 1,4-dihydroxy-2-naphthoyl-CoA hydrolase [Legionella quinlivanii DSM 21216]STY11050.1 esterase [Legionella quinlivanii]
MPIWSREITIEQLNQYIENTMSEVLGMEFVEIGDDFLKASMPVNERTRQPFGLLHGGANVALAETVASMAANGVIDPQKYYCVGLEINANHLRAVKEGVVTAIATPIHLGRTTQVWEINIFDEGGKKTCVSRMTAAIVKR